MSNQQTEEPQTNRFEALCSEIGEYDHLPALTHEQAYAARIITGDDDEATLDASILEGLVHP
jgi:hypothetical protein